MDDMEKKVDRRILKTKRAIRNAFAELLSQKDMNAITIKDIADLADINRKTFYNYYSGIHEVVDEIENEIVAAFNEIMGEIDFRREMKNPYPIFAKLTNIINNDLDFFSHLMRADNNYSLMPKITAALKEKMRLSFASQILIQEEVLDIITEYVFSGMMSVYRTWFNSDRTRSIDELSKLVSILTTSGMNGVLEGAYSSSK